MSESSTRDSEVSRPESSRTDSPRCVVRYGNTRLLGDFEARRDQRFQRGDEVIVRSERGVEWGVVLCPADARSAPIMGGGRSAGGRCLGPGRDAARLARDE
ncbi:MAG: hypothetical protein ACK56X_13855, partial [Planctomyces sp.]